LLNRTANGALNGLNLHRLLQRFVDKRFVATPTRQRLEMRNNSGVQINIDALFAYPSTTVPLAISGARMGVSDI